MQLTAHTTASIIQLDGCNPASTLPPWVPNTNAPSTLWQALGAAQYLALCDPYQNENLASFVPRVCTAWTQRQCQILINEAQQPWAYLAWCWLSSQRHKALLDGVPITSENWLTCPHNAEPYLWLVDFITPFGHDEKAKQHWQKHFAHTAASGWLLHSGLNNAPPTFQQLW